MVLTFLTEISSRIHEGYTVCNECMVYAVILIIKVNVFHSLQVEGSSDPSAQSVPPSQNQCAGIQRPFVQRNSFWVHVDVAKGAGQIL